MKIKNYLNRKYILLIIVIVVCNSCKMTLLRMSGYFKNPKLEDAASIKKYASKKKDPFDVLTIANSKTSFIAINKKYSGIPTVLVYDKKFNVLANAHGESCHKRLITFFSDSLEFEYKKTFDSSYTFVMDRVVTIDQKNIDKPYDYTIIYFWTKWTPRFRKDLFGRLNEIKVSDRYKIRFISLNMDWQKGQFAEAPRLGNKVTSNGHAGDPKK